MEKYRPGLSLAVTMSDREWMQFDNSCKSLMDDLTLIATYDGLLKEICESASLEQMDAAMIGEHVELQAKAKAAWDAWLDEHIGILNAKNRGELHNYLSLLEHDHVDSYTPALKSMLPVSAITSLSARRRLPFKEALYDLLIIDELSYLTFNRSRSELLFQVVSECSERTSVIITTNLEFSQWTQLFENEMMVAALVDRVTFNSQILNMNCTTSYRMETALNGQPARRT